MEAYHLYKVVFFKFIRGYGKLTGIDLTDPHYEPFSRTYCWMTINYIMFISGANTILTAESEMAWKNLTILGLTVQGIVKYFVLLHYRKLVAAKVVFLEGVYKQNCYPGATNACVLLKWAERGHFFVKYGIIAFALPLVVFLAYPVAVYVQSGERELILPMVIPGLDSSTLKGYIMTTILILGGCALAFFGTAACDFMLVVLVVHMWPLSDVFENMMDELNAKLNIVSYRKTPELKEFFRNITMLHREMCEYLQDISEVYYIIIFFEVFTCAESMCTVLYCLMDIKWLPLYFLFIVMFITLLAFCVLGTVAEMATDRIYMILMNSKWYLLPLPLQHHMGLMIARAQNPTILMAGTLPLNLDTFVSVMKTVYSVGMLLAGTV